MKRMVVKLTAVAGMVGMAACGGGGAGRGTPREVADDMVKAMMNGDTTTVGALIPSDALLKASFACPEGSEVFAKMAKARAELAEEVTETKTKLAGGTIKVSEFDKEGTESKTLAVGDPLQDCKATKAVKLHKSKLTLVFEKDGKSDNDGETMTFVELDGRWYIGPK